jgi:hypothetical protein
MIAEGHEDAPVTYDVHVQRRMITPTPTDLEIEGPYTAEVSVQTEKAYSILETDRDYQLKLADGMLVTVYVETSLGSGKYVLLTNDAKDLAEKYGERDG